MKIKQSKDRKKATTHYCAIHKIHYFDYCPMCPNTPQMQLEETVYKLQIKADHAHKLGD